VVTTPSRERTALLVIRAWIETNSETQLRARITQTADLNGRKEISTAAATRDDIASAVTEWLDRLLEDRR